MSYAPAIASSAACQPYAIDIDREHLLAIVDIPAWIEKRRAGKRPHINGVRRWLKRPGVRGIVLPTTMVGGRRFTSCEALVWWLAATNAAASNMTAAVPVGASLSPADAAVLRKAGILETDA